VVQLGDQLDDARIAAEFGALNLQAMARLSAADTARVEAYADMRFAGQSHELKLLVRAPRWAEIEQDFIAAYAQRYGAVPQGRRIELVTLRLRRIGHEQAVKLPRLERDDSAGNGTIDLTDATGRSHRARAASRKQLIGASWAGPLLILDREATTYVPPQWRATIADDAAVHLTREPA
jgi:N-methylhydantoinase A/oxoprolinase/acetone carboxylase beta subunit